MTATATPPRPRPRAGFTLIELMIAISLGLVIIGTVVSGLRVASQAFTLVNRLAQENQLMRVGCEVAHDHLDYWTDIDDPDGPASNRPLRGHDGNGGLPFTPMADIAPYVAGATRELDTGWNAAEPWVAADPRTWWHGNLAATVGTNVIFGHYSIFTNSAQSTGVGRGAAGTYGTVTVPHNWLNNQLWTMYTALGYYGYLDYTPAGTLYQSYLPLSGGTNDDGEALVLDTPYGHFANGEGNQRYPYDMYRLTMGTAIGLVSPSAGGATASGTHQQYYWLDYTNPGGQGTFNQFNADTMRSAPLLASNGPAVWPRVAVSVQRFIKNNRFANACRVVCTSPLTGEHAQLVWNGIGSTLRGARLQRAKAGGWATWDDDPLVASNSPTIDDP
jgi:prepilin-type N-terminal cleavage/methylation domain-containing protein